MLEKLKVAVAQTSPVFMDKEATIDKTCRAMEEAGRNGAQLIVFSETHIPGYPYWRGANPISRWSANQVEYMKNAVSVPGPDTEALCQAARDNEIVAVVGCTEMSDIPGSNTLYNTVLFIDADGTLLGRHRKLMPTHGERTVWGRGDSRDLKVFKTSVGTVGGLICYEHQIRKQLSMMDIVLFAGVWMDRDVEKWLSRFARSTAETYRFHFERWMGWMAENGGELAGLTPGELLEYQRNASNSDKYVILDLLQRHVREVPGRFNYKMKPYTAIRSFFVHSRAELPPDKGFILRAEKPPVVGTLTIEEVRQVIMTSSPLYQAVFLCILQGGIDEAGIVDWSKAGYRDLVRDLPDIMSLSRKDRILRIDLPGRKKYRNIKPFYTYVGADALEAVENWLKRRPRDAETIFVNQYGDPLSEGSMRTYWTRKLKRLGLVEPGEPGDKGTRYGKNLHEVRDVFRSMWEKTPAKGSVAEFMMGHRIDPLEYNKAYRDEGWVRSEYRKAMPLLQIISSGRPFGQVDEEEVEILSKRVKELEAKIVSDSQRYESGKDELGKMIKEILTRVAALEKEG